MRAYRLTAQAQAAVTDVPEPRPAAEEVVLGVLGAGVCRTDLGLLQSGLPNAPVTLGHEIVGQVLDVGSSVDPAKVGR